jgi:hypothetical protein
MITKTVAEHAKRFAIFSGWLDIVAPTRELRAALGDQASLVKRIRGHHAPLSKRAGKKQIEKAARWAVSA